MSAISPGAVEDEVGTPQPRGGGLLGCTPSTSVIRELSYTAASHASGSPSLMRQGTNRSPSRR
ncbi:hypothetical protein GKJPGBOP_01994 [Streptomyces paromomycinus]|uniref:Uncharacterized protein n=1 Tax=Streptomyces paromomycinus TaxID=92743 RepID=A0A401VZ26_STREY|nr:hypothetical protein GKJPGBOP_01994 [Streptomyces paromomycinus]